MEIHKRTITLERKPLIMSVIVMSVMLAVVFSFMVWGNTDKAITIKTQEKHITGLREKLTEILGTSPQQVEVIKWLTSDEGLSKVNKIPGFKEFKITKEYTRQGELYFIAFVKGKTVLGDFMLSAHSKTTEGAIVELFKEYEKAKEEFCQD